MFAVASADIDRVERQDVFAQTGGRPRVKRQVAALAQPGEPLVERHHRVARIPDGGRDEQHPRPLLARQAERVGVEQARPLDGLSPASESHDLPQFRSVGHERRVYEARLEVRRVL